MQDRIDKANHGRYPLPLGTCVTTEAKGFIAKHMMHVVMPDVDARHDDKGCWAADLEYVYTNLIRKCETESYGKIILPLILP